MKKRSTRFLSLSLSLLMVVTILPAGIIQASAATFTPRYSAPSRTGWYAGYSRNNCVAYAQCRANEILGYSAYLGRFSDQGGWYAYCKRTGAFETGNYPRPGAIACFSGHVAVVESVSGNRIVTSEAHYTFQPKSSYHSYSNTVINGGGGSRGTWFTNWSGTFNTSTGRPNYLSNQTFRGYVYLTPSAQSQPTPPAPPAIPDKPTITGISATDIAVGKSVTITWNGSARATAYNVAVRGAENRDLGTDANARSYTLTLSKVGTYTIYVEAKNQSGTSSNNNSRTCTAHANSTVKFVDWDGKELHTQSVRYGESATAPASPTRKGYTFQGWSDSFYNVTANRTIRANYKINTYTVNFLDKEKKVLKSEKVEYGKDATPPTDVNVPTGYIFVGWQSQDYKSVYTDATNKTINVQGIYEWKNKTLPIVCQITSAKRQSDGYYVYFDLTNTPNAITRGRAVVSLKTKTGKLVDATESAAFSIPKGGTKKGMEVFIPCDYAATTAEVIIVDSYSSGVPFSENMAATIDQGLMWSAWSGTKPSGTDLQIETRTEYRFRDKETKTGSSKTMDGWIWDGTKQTKLISQTGYQDSVMSTYDNETGKRALLSTQSVPIYSTRWKYVYYHFYKRGGGNHTFCPTNHAGGTYHGLYSNYSAFEWYKKSSCGSRDLYRGTACPECGSSAYWFYNSGDSGNETYQSGSKTQYNYGIYQYIYNFYRWKDWSDWTDASITATSAKQVETRTAYRYKSNSAGAENDSGKQYTIRKKVDASFAGKQM